MSCYQKLPMNDSSNVLNVILDIDETLIHTIEIKSASGQESIFLINMRPHLKQFLEFLFKHYNVAIWTAGSEDYAKQVLSEIMTKEQIEKLIFVYNSKNCTWRRNSDGELKIIKNLKKIEKKMQLERTVIVDDMPQTAVKNYGNLISIPAFDDETMTEDDYLLKLIEYLKRIDLAGNVRKIEKRGWAKSRNVNK